MIGPDSPIEIRSGSSYDAQAMYPVTDGPLFPLRASVQWSISPPVKGISIDAKSGKIRVDAGVPHGASTTVHADVAHGRRKLEEKLYVFNAGNNPLIGRWVVGPNIVCGQARETKSPAPRPRSLLGTLWKFHVDGQFWVGKEMGKAAGTLLSGNYELDLGAAKIKLSAKVPEGKPESSWSYVLKDSGKTLLLRPLESWDDLEPGCGYILSLR